MINSRRFSLCAIALGSRIYVFGGELVPRQPRDNNFYKIFLNPASNATVELVHAQGMSPSPRIGAATTAINGNIYMSSGRGGEAMAPIEENGRVWCFDPSTERWTSLAPSITAYLEARSYYAMTNNGSETIYAHAGCPEKGRLADLWAFNIHGQEWKPLTSTPRAQRGGPPPAYVDRRVCRMNGFDGKTEQGGALDVYDVASDNWSSIEFSPDGKEGPGARSVAALVPVRKGGDMLLITLFGESDPSSLGHLGAGKMLSDVWSYSVLDRVWNRVDFDGDGAPQARGWLDADFVVTEDVDGLVVVGGLGESNERLDDAWLLRFRDGSL